MSELIARLKYERDRMYTLWCSGSRRDVEGLVRGQELGEVLNDAMVALAQQEAAITELEIKFVQMSERLAALENSVH